MSAVDPGRPVAGVLGCFAIGPVGDPRQPVGSPGRSVHEEAAQLYEQVVRPACAGAGLEPVRAEPLSPPGELTERFCRQVMHADVLVADLTGGDPNVLYALGIRHLLGRPAVQLGERGRLPFDDASIRTIRFVRDVDGLAAARADLERVLRATLRDGFELPAPARLLSGMPPREPAAGTGGPSGGFVEVAAELTATVADMNAVTRSINELAEAVEEFGPQLHRSGKPAESAAARLAAALHGPAAALDRHADRFADRMAGLDRTVCAVLDLARSDPARRSVVPEPESFPAELVGTAAAVREGLVLLEHFRALLPALAALGEPLRPVAERIGRAVGRLREAMVRAEGWERRGSAAARERVAAGPGCGRGGAQSVSSTLR